MNAERAFSCVKGAVDIKDIQNCRPPRLHTASGTATTVNTTGSALRSFTYLSSTTDS
nr:MAG TPA: hypothetical protein [Caudoviricetes sp.]